MEFTLINDCFGWLLVCVWLCSLSIRNLLLLTESKIFHKVLFSEAMIHIIVFLCFYFLSFGFSGSVTSRFGFDVALYSRLFSHGPEGTWEWPVLFLGFN